MSIIAVNKIGFQYCALWELYGATILRLGIESWKKI